MTRGERRSDRRGLRWAMVTLAVVVATCLASPFVLLWSTNRSLASDRETLEAWATLPAVGDPTRCRLPERVRSLAARADGVERMCQWIDAGRDPACQDRLTELAPLFAAVEGCSPTDRVAAEDPLVAGLLGPAMAAAAREGGRACVEAALDAYRARAPRDWWDQEVLIEPAMYLASCSEALPPDERRAVALELWAAANELPPPHHVRAALLVYDAPHPVAVSGPQQGESFEAWLEHAYGVRLWVAAADGVLDQGPIPAMTPADPLRAFDPHEPSDDPTGVAVRFWLSSQADLRGLAVRLRGDAGLADGWASDLEARRLELRRLPRDCVEVVGAAFPGRPRAALRCRGGSPRQAATEWLGRAGRALLAHRVRTGAWHAPIGEARIAVGDAGSVDDPAWAALGVDPPRHPYLRVAIRIPDRPLDYTDGLLEAAYAEGDEVRAIELAFGDAGEGPEVSTALYSQGPVEVERSGFCLAPCR
ncbi:MAG: hypothetical protein H6719_31140 [Sandaracinaceae bacterium]|nr:hypothetical protein [Sandaracinaceae bacterium]